jgi:4'-phosphopantetheinyl transferase EntD
VLGDGGLTHDELRSFRAGLAGILPPEAVLAVWGLDARETALLPVERAAISRAVPSRRREFARGRACARAALAALGLDPVAVPVGPDREPLWPEGVVGSITHAGDRVAAVVASTSGLAAIGIDVEARRPMAPDVRARVMLAEDRVDVGEAGPLVVFSAKEAVFKALFPGTRVWMGFDAVMLEEDAESGRLWARPSGRSPAAPGVEDLSGAYRVTDEWVTTAFWRRSGPESTRSA